MDSDNDITINNFDKISKQNYDIIFKKSKIVHR